jgi:DNA-binding MarR family transcriptional regulator
MPSTTNKLKMNVQVKIVLASEFNPIDVDEMFTAAKALTNDVDGIHVYETRSKNVSLWAEFTVDKAPQGEIVDKIRRKFEINMSNYGEISISFPENDKKSAKSSKRSNARITKKQGQYLSFIYYYTKVNKSPPAESDFQKYFNVSPPSIHHMIIKLEEKGFISRVRNTPRSIKLLVNRAEIPDLD